MLASLGYDNLDMKFKVDIDSDVDVQVKFPQGSVVSMVHDTVPLEVTTRRSNERNSSSSAVAQYAFFGT